MKTNLVRSGFALVIAAGLLLAAHCPRQDKESAERMLEKYWRAVFEGNVRKAYSMFDRKSKEATSLEEFANRIAFGLDRSPLKDSFWTEYAALCELSMGPVNIRDDTAYADVLLTIPNLARLGQDLKLEADSLFGPGDSVSSKEWMMRRRILALKEHHYMPLVMHLSLRLHWERGGWYLVYD